MFMKRWVDRTFGVALGASIALHSGGVSAPLIYEWWSGQPAPFLRSMPKPIPPKKISFKFIDSPEKTIEKKVKKETKNISNKDTGARDKDPKEIKDSKPGPALARKGDFQQLAKKTQPNILINQVKGKPIPKEKFITPKQAITEKLKDEPLKEEEDKAEEPKEEISKERVKKLRAKLDALEEIKTDLEKKLKEEKTLQKFTKQGNAQKNKQIFIFNPERNIDTYQSQAIQKFLSTAVNVGEISFDAKKHILGPYLKKLKSQIAPLWRLKLESQTFGSLLTSKKVVLGIKIMSDGALGGVLLLEDNGDDLFNKICLDTVIEAAPFAVLPKEWLEQRGLDYLNLIYTFTVI